MNRASAKLFEIQKALDECCSDSKLSSCRLANKDDVLHQFSSDNFVIVVWKNGLANYPNYVKERVLSAYIENVAGVIITPRCSTTTARSERISSTYVIARTDRRNYKIRLPQSETGFICTYGEDVAFLFAKKG